MNWWFRWKNRDKERALDAYVARERAAAKAAHEDTRRQAEETRTLRAESSRVNEAGRRIREQNQFTVWLNRALRGVQEGGR